ncbi:heparinase II/III domain-containing protein [Rikenella microfusus]|uniref:heparinase II/III domain-containing protein n=1 Tax=Rikenella microfusus TaxID=28139 RepID=UPI001DDA7397|nr:heparinase II/III family protein [Rikenella microfusus]HJE87693.1 heparinase II/III-family protein [Rikenella microfusus]
MKQTKRFMAVLLLTGLLGAAPLFMEAAPAVRAKPDLLQKAAARYDMDSMCREVYKPYPGYADRGFWQSLPEAVKRQAVRQAEARLDYVWRSVTVTSYLDFARKGVRVPNDRHIGERYGALADLMLGELVEGRGRFMDQIADGVWSLCEQSSWVAAAHIYWQLSGTAVPDIDHRTIDLSGGMTANTLAWAYYFFKDDLGKLSPTIPQRLRAELNRHTLDVYLERDDMFWLGFREGAQVNNWNPWCNFNVLTTALLAEEDPVRRAAIVKKTMRSVDQFINFFKPDGGCEEGPSYWTHAAGMLNNYLEVLRDYSHGEIDLFGEQRVKNIGLYIAHAHIDSLYFVNFADAEAKASPGASTVFRYGRNIADSTMMRFGSYLGSLTGFGENPLGGTMDNRLKTISAYRELCAARPLAPLYRSVWMDGIEVAVARTQGGSARGLTLAAKGGYNAESHNHNDVGSFILYVDGQPMLVDAGVGTYTAATFDHRRYTIWMMQSEYHNLPVVNGFGQKDGHEYRSRRVAHSDNGRVMDFSLDIAGAYPAEAACRSWVRDYRFDRRRNTVTLTDSYELAEVKGSVALNFLTCGTVKLGKTIEIAAGDRTLLMAVDASKYEMTAEAVELTDPRLSKIWGERLTRIVLKVKDPKQKDTLRVTFSQK